MRNAVVVLAASLAALSCGGPEAPRLDRVPPGSWGGDHVALEVSLGEAQVEFDCAHGRIDGPLGLAADGSFRQKGVFVRERGGPVGGDIREDAHPAVYFGATDGRRMAFLVTLTDEGQTLGPFTLFYSARPILTKCL